MTNPMIRIHNVETDEIVDRPMTNEEYELFLNPPKSQLPSEASTL